jgi:hypothetical protein
MGLRPPPRIPSDAEISRLRAEAPHLAGPRGVSLSLRGGQETRQGFADPKSLASNSLFLGNRDCFVGDRFDWALRLEVEAERSVLTGPFGGHIADAGYADAAWQASFEGGLDQSGR